MVVELIGLVVTIPYNNQQFLDFLSGGTGSHFIGVIRWATSFSGVYINPTIPPEGSTGTPGVLGALPSAFTLTL